MKAVMRQRPRPVVEAVLGSGVAYGFAGNRRRERGLACSGRLPHNYKYTEAETKNEAEDFTLNLQFVLQSESMVATMRLLCLGVTWGDFEWVTSRLAPARWVDVRVI